MIIVAKHIDLSSKVAMTVGKGTRSLNLALDQNFNRDGFEIPTLVILILFYFSYKEGCVIIVYLIIIKREREHDVQFFSSKLLFITMNYYSNGRGCNHTFRLISINLMNFSCIFIYLLQVYFSWWYRIRVFNSQYVLIHNKLFSWFYTEFLKSDKKAGKDYIRLALGRQILFHPYNKSLSTICNLRNYYRTSILKSP